MKKSLLIILLFTPFLSWSQPWLPENAAKKVKLQDVIDVYKKEHPLFGKHVVKDEKDDDFQFGRWLWYWQQHIDDSGYLVSPARTVNEWTRFVNARKYARTTSVTNPSQWYFFGPKSHDFGMGRISTVCFHPTDANTYWVATAGGGVWKTTDNGAHWNSIGDDLPMQATSDIDADPKNPNVLYVCTGDGDGRYPSTVGIYKTIDGGQNWFVTKLTSDSANYIYSLAINPVNPNTLLAATSSGLFKSNDAGNSWKKVLKRSCRQVMYNVADTSIVYVSADNEALYSVSAVYSSFDGGDKWINSLTIGASTFTRASIAVCNSNPNEVVAIVANSSTMYGLYKSTDSSRSFQQLIGNTCDSNLLSYDDFWPTHNCDGQGRYDLCIAIDPGDSNSIYVGGIYIWHSGNGGKAWSVTDEDVHMDKHFLAFSPLLQHRLFQCNDGGIYYTDGGSWKNVSSGLYITQFYKIGVDDKATYVLGGAQDNHSVCINGAETVDIDGGDGMVCLIDPMDTTTYYTSYQMGVFFRHKAIPNGPIDGDCISKNLPGGQKTGSWTTPLIIHPQQHHTLIAGYDRLYISYDQGNSWSKFSDTSYGWNTIKHIAMSPADTNTVYYYVETTSYICVTHDFGKTWFKIKCPYLDIITAGSLTDIMVDPNDGSHLYVVIGASKTRVASYDPVNGWVDLTSNMPVVQVNCIVEDGKDNTLYVGTDEGVLYYNKAEKAWDLFNNMMPFVRVDQLVMKNSANEIWAATYGRGIWKSKTVYGKSFDLLMPDKNDFIVLPNPNQGNFILQGSDNFINKNCTVDIYNIDGRVIYKREQVFSYDAKLFVNVGSMPCGIYIAEVAIGNVVSRQKLVIQ